MAGWGATLSPKAQRKIHRSAKKAKRRERESRPPVAVRRAIRTVNQGTRTARLTTRAKVTRTPLPAIGLRGLGASQIPTVRASVRTAERQRAIDSVMEGLREEWEETHRPLPGVLRRGPIGSIGYELGVVDDEDLDAARKKLYGTENPGLGGAALAMTPIGRISRPLGAIGKAVGVASKGKQAKRVGDTVKMAEKAAVRAAPKTARVKQAASRTAKRQVKKRKGLSAKEKAKAARTQAGRRGVYGPKAQRYAELGAKIGGPGLAVGAVGGERYLTALADDPKKTLGTTASAIPAMGTAIVAAPINAAVAIKEGDTDALKKFIEQQKDYYETVANIANPGFSDAEARRLIQEDVGLIPAISTALGAGAVAKYGMPRPTPSVSVPVVGREARLNRAYRDRQSSDINVRRKAEEKIQKAKPARKEDRQQRVEESKRQAVTADRTERQLEREMRITGKGKKRVDARMLDLLQFRINDDVTVGDTVQLIGRESLRGLDEKAVLRELDAIERKMVDPTRPLSDTTVHTRQVIAALRENPDIPNDPDMHELLDGLAELQRGRSQERLEERTGTRRATEPDPDDVGPQLLHVAQTNDIPLASERPPTELRGVTRTQTKPGQEMEPALRKEAQGARRTAKTKKGQARVARAQRKGAAREVNLRRIADDRRVAVRTQDKVLKNMIRRRDTWARKLKEAKTDAQRNAAAAKVRDYDERIKFRKARIAMNASPARLSAVRKAEEARIREEALLRAAADDETRAELIEGVVNRERRAEALNRAATDLEREGGDPDEVARMRAESKVIRAQHVEAQRVLGDEFAQEVRARLAEKGQDEPIFFKARDASDRGVMQGQNEYRGANLAKREKRLMGTLAKQGRIDEAGGVLLENIARGRHEIEIKRHTREFANDRTLKDENGEMRLVTGEEARRLVNRGEVPPGTSLFPVQELSAAFQRGAWDEAAGLLDNTTMAQLRQMRGVKGKKYAMVPEPALREFHAQMQGYGNVLKNLRYLSRAQSLMLLATSPAWFSWQLAASPLTALYSHPNPARWAKASKQSLVDLKKVPERDLIDWRAEHGGTVADAIDFQDRRLGMDADAVRAADSSIRTARKTPGYKALAAVGNNLKKGGPFIQFNRRYEAEYRDLVALIQMDKEINPSRVLKFIDSIFDTHRFVEQDVAHLRGKPLAEQIRFYNDNPKAARRLANKVDDAMGNWNALTAKERNFQALTVFFPFLRFSTRWLLKTYPRDNPLRAAFLANLAAANTMEYEKLLGEEPSFFPDFGNIVIQSAEPTAINMSRVAPGSNALVESLGGGELNLQTALRPFQPIAGITASALSGQNPITGLPLPEGMSKGESFVKGVVGLNPLTRPLANQIGPEPSAYSQLFRAITEREGDLKQYAIPRIETDLPKERVAARASVLMDLTFGEDTPTEQRTAARAELYGLMREYGITPPGEESSSPSGASSSGGWGGTSSSTATGWGG